MKAYLRCSELTVEGKVPMIEGCIKDIADDEKNSKFSFFSMRSETMFRGGRTAVDQQQEYSGNLFTRH